MSYTATSKYGKKITVVSCDGLANVEIEGSGDVLIWTKDAPALALNILLAAGIDMDHESVGLSMAARHLRDVVSINEATKRAEAQEKRRAAVCKELGAAYTPNASDTPLLRAVDRIIELAEKLESAS